MLEVYEAFGSWETMADLIEELIATVAQNVFGTLQIEHPNGRKINLQRPWRRVRLADLVEERTGWKFDKRPLKEAMPDLFSNADLSTVRSRLEQISPAEQVFQVYEKLVEHTLIDPCFVTHIPSVIIPLAKKNTQDPFFADVYELAINGVEISPGYSELNDPDMQAANFAHQVGDKDEQQKMDEDFLNALRYGMPPAGGLGMGIDRLVMMLTGAESIRDVILFPLMKPHEK
jgi:lysyl-tRNA synthetase class 2